MPYGSLEKKLRDNDKYKDYRVVRVERGEGYDVLLVRNGEAIYVEVKGMRKEWGEISLIGREPLMAKNMKIGIGS